MHNKARIRHADLERSFDKRDVKRGNSSTLVLSQIRCYDCGSLGHKRASCRNKKKHNASQHMHTNATSMDSKTRRKNRV